MMPLLRHMATSLLLATALRGQAPTDSFTLARQGVLRLKAHGVAAIRTPAGVFVFRNQGAVLVIERHDTTLAVITQFIPGPEVPGPESPPVFQAGNFRVVFVARLVAPHGTEMVVGLVWRPSYLRPGEDRS